MQHRTLSFLWSVVAVCGLALAVIGATASGGARADENAAAAPAPGVVGTWDYAEDRTAPEHNRDPRERPPLGPSFKVSQDGKTWVVEHVRRGALVISRVGENGAEDVVQEDAATRTTSGMFEGGVLTFTNRRTSERAGTVSTSVVEFTLTPGKDGLLVRMHIKEPSPAVERTALYRAGVEVPAPKAVKAAIASLAWLEGRFTTGLTGESGKQKEMEEHWGTAGGGAMLGTARTVRDGRMSSFEYLRIVERNGGLVYVAQPGGGPATEFVLTEISETRALFENPTNEYPKRIVYERLPAPKDGQDGLRTEISGGGGAFAVSYTRTR